MWMPRRTRVAPYTMFLRERTLPEPGQVLVQVGDFVQAMDTVARLVMPSGLCAVNVAQEFGIQGREITPFLVKEVGEPVAAGEAVAMRKGPLGLFQRVCRSPADGRIWRITENQVLVEGEPKVVDLLAHVRGHVLQLLGDRGAVIQTPAAWLQGNWGTGGEGHGVLQILTERDAPLLAAEVDISSHGGVVVAGVLDDEGGLEQLLQMQARGIVVGSVSMALIPRIEEAGIPLVAMEGLGNAPMAPEFFELLQSHNGEEVSLLGVAPGLNNRMRPEVLIPVTESEEPVADLPEEISIGARVRLLRGSHQGEMGTVKSLPWHPQPVEIGRRVGASIELDSGHTVFVPWNNLDLIG